MEITGNPTAYKALWKSWKMSQKMSLAKMKTFNVKNFKSKLSLCFLNLELMFRCHFLYELFSEKRVSKECHCLENDKVNILEMSEFRHDYLCKAETTFFVVYSFKLSTFFSISFQKTFFSSFCLFFRFLNILVLLFFE